MNTRTVNTNIHQQPSTVEEVAKRRQISRMLVEMLISESLYKQAADIVVGTVNRFTDYRVEHERIMSGAGNSTANLDATALEMFVTWRAEIVYLQRWSQSVLSNLPDHEDAIVLRTVFANANRIGAFLLQSLQSAEKE